jgi:hypothetical protein
MIFSKRVRIWLLVVIVVQSMLAACVAVQSTPQVLAPTATSVFYLPNIVQGEGATDIPSGSTTPAAPVEIKGIGILGDSTSDEYRAEDARGGEYARTTLSWVEQLDKSRDLNLGKWGVRDEPRRSGYEYNWARSGATAHSMITGNQHTGLAEQVAQGKVNVVVIWIGGNDFHLKNGPYEEIYNGTLRGAALQAKIDGIVEDITLAVDTIMAAGDVKLGIVTVSDQGMARQALTLYPDAAKRQRVTDAVDAVNQKLIELAKERGAIVIDSNQIALDLFAMADSEGFITFGGEKITILEPGDEPHHLQLGDWIGHSGTVLSGIIANKVFIEPFSAAYGFDIAPLSDEEILKNAGIR